ncbi:hypothetical protein LINPERHAP1_LOCUS6934 [Linum perenne]
MSEFGELCYNWIPKLQSISFRYPTRLIINSQQRF